MQGSFSGPASWDEGKRRCLRAKRQGSEGRGAVSQFATVLPCDVEQFPLTHLVFSSPVFLVIICRPPPFSLAESPTLGPTSSPDGQWPSLCATSPRGSGLNTWAWINVCSNDGGEQNAVPLLVPFQVLSSEKAHDQKSSE